MLKNREQTGEQKTEENKKRLSIDGTLLPSFAFKERSGYLGKHRRVGVKASIVVDAISLPLAITLARGNAHDISLAEGTMEKLANTSKYVGSTIAADKGYDSRKFRKYAFYHGIKPNIPKRSTTIEANTRDPYGSHFDQKNKDIGKARFIVERTNAWIKSFRRLRCRFDYNNASYEAFIYLAVIVIVILIRRLVL